MLEWDNNCNTATLISKFNLNKEATKQQDAAREITACAFSSEKYWKSSFTSSPFSLNDFPGYISTDAIGRARNYGRSKGAISSRLLSYDEARDLEGKKDSNSKIYEMYIGTANTANGCLSYWLETAGTDDSVWTVFKKRWVYCI